MRAGWWQFGLGRENGLTFWAMVFLEASFGSFFALWPLWIEELGASISTVGWLLGLGGILRLFSLSPSAMMARRFGLKRVLVVSRTFASIGIGSAALATGWPWLLPAMLAMALGDMAFPLASTYIAANAGANRVRAFAIILTMGPSVSLMLTPLISGGLVRVWGLRAPFVAAMLFSLISVSFLARLRPVAPPPADGGQRDARYLDLLAIPRLPRLLALQFATFFSLGLGTSLISNYLHDEAGYSESLVAALTSATAVGSIIFATVVAHSVRLARVPLRAVAMAVAGTAIAYLLFLKPDFMPLVLLALTLRGGFFAAWPLFSAVLGEAAPERLRPHVYAMGEILAGTGFVVSPVVAGQLYNLFPELPLIAASAMLAPLIAALARMRPLHAPEARAEDVVAHGVP